MNKIIVAVLVMLLMSSAWATGVKSTIIKGSDYISTDVGVKYNYTRISVALDDNIMDHKNGSQTIKVISCNESKTKCSYFVEFTSASGAVIGSYKSTNIIKNGSVYNSIGNASPSILFPAEIQLNKVIKYSSKYNGIDVNGSYKFVKQIDNVTVNKRVFNNCVELKGKSISILKNKDKISNSSTEIYCSGVGLVKEVFTSSNNSNIEYTLDSIEKT